MRLNPSFTSFYSCLFSLVKSTCTAQSSGSGPGYEASPSSMPFLTMELQGFTVSTFGGAGNGGNGEKGHGLVDFTGRNCLETPGFDMVSDP